MLSTEELLVPRYIVTADWPGILDEFSVGYVFTHPYGRVYMIEECKYAPSDFPHLFKLLEWWEERKVEDMPEYVSYPNGRIVEVDNWYSHNECFVILESQVKEFTSRFLPATESDYLKQQAD